MSVVTIRNLDPRVKAGLQRQAAAHGRSTEAEARAIPAEAVRPPGEGFFATLHRTFADLGGVELELPATVAEIEYGLARLPEGSRFEELRSAAAGLWRTFATAILPFEIPAAHHYGTLMAGRERAGRPASAFDAQIAAIAPCTKPSSPPATCPTSRAWAEVDRSLGRLKLSVHPGGPVDSATACGPTTR